MKRERLRGVEKTCESDGGGGGRFIKFNFHRGEISTKADSHICRCYSITNNQERERERDQAKRKTKQQNKNNNMIKKVMYGNLPRDLDMSLPAG